MINEYSFASRSVPRHLLRGVVGLSILAASFGLISTIGPLSLLLAPLGVIALRGCPTCWLFGLTQTISRGRLKRSCVEGEDCRLTYPRAMIASAASVPERQALSTRGDPSGHH
ncbi:MAG: hypothetical protein JWM76_4483 [Pseudonocardiales bacterium]|nr:hypothetical protein [Pseudonocardiales bacterium]